MNKQLVRIQNPQLKDIVNIILTRLAKWQLQGTPLSRKHLNAFQLWWVDKMLMDSIVIETETGHLFVDDDQIAQFGQFDTIPNCGCGSLGGGR